MTKANKKNIAVFTNDFSKEVYDSKYRYGNETISDTWDRVSRAVAEPEKDKEQWRAKFRELLEGFKFIPGGRILSNAGLTLGGTTLINCYVSGFQGTDRDSMEGILDELRRQALILKSEGGYGFCVDTLRPRYSFIAGIGSESPGAVKMLDMWDTQSDVITSGSGKKSKNSKAKSGIRKGAQMVTMSIWHPDIEEFINAKRTPGRLTKFNMSVLVTDAFMNAVRARKQWSLIFPDIENARLAYKERWDGNIDKWIADGLPVKVFKTYEDASELWNMITNSTYTRNEPGILFVDRINHWNNMYYNEHISSTNPCGEQPLPIGGVCLLGSLNLTQFVNGDDLDYEKLRQTIKIAVRFMDNVNDITYVPLPEQRESLVRKRRIGLGIMGYASALVMMKTRYGSPEALELTDRLMRFITNEAYSASAELAAEKGSFPEFDAKKYMAGNFVKTLAPATRALIEQFGLRNSHLMSVQPTGNTSSLANVVSGGLEPIYRPQYVRTMIVDNWPDHVRILSNVDFANKKYDVSPAMDGSNAASAWEWTKEGDENILRGVFDENGESIVYKYDQNRGLTRESVVMDYGVAQLNELGEYDKDAEYMVDTAKLSIDDHINTMTVIAKYIDSAMSKTINIPNDYSFDDFKRVYDKIYDSGVIKGCTTYRDGTMTAVLSETGTQPAASSTAAIQKILRTKAPKRPKALECDIHHLTINGDKWLVFIGLYGDARDPYEVFAFKRNGIQISPKVTFGKLIKVKQRNHQTRYDLDLGDIIIEDICSHFKTGEESALTRMISTALRHGADMDYIYDQLMKAEGTVVSFSKAVARSIKTYVKTVHDSNCPECGGEGTVVMTEGCMKCTACGASKC
jgi:ribonucleoside-diphosphate reductase alpha chain